MAEGLRQNKRSTSFTFVGSHYRLLPAAREPRHTWMFEGIEGDILGDFGLSGGGAVGFELDCADTHLAPHAAVILARSEDPPRSFVTIQEEVLDKRRCWPGGAR